MATRVTASRAMRMLSLIKDKAADISDPPLFHQAVLDLHGNVPTPPPHGAAEQLDIATAQFDHGLRCAIEIQFGARFPGENIAQGHGEFVQNGIDLDIGLPELTRQM